MEKNLIDSIKKTEEESAAQISKTREVLDKEMAQRIKLWEKKERELNEEYSKKNENILSSLKDKVKKIDAEIEKTCQQKEEETKKETRKTFKVFQEEVLKRL